MTFQLQIIDTKRQIFSGEAEKLVLPALGGEMTVLPKHMALVTPVNTGEVKYVSKSHETSLSIGKGVFAMQNNVATLLIEDARFSEEISEQEAQKAKDKAQEIIAKGVKGSELEAAEGVLRRSLIDIKIARKKKLRIS